ncbi:hypothetical protein PG911_11770 [Tenacibaculum ovolyticum]|uniref:hypothetical protein n=1 Tax=Tenacibaculum ovolyticum TaxID=104270 RepID=UPI0007EE0DC0|nr:hypothetical protein [Tenacibaculum ovolyticum]WBX75334.1 hypothetical protein PG911_11770 [Tenacibaculum ovolyticum]
MKKRKLAIVLLLIILITYSCNKDDSEIKENEIEEIVIEPTDNFKKSITYKDSIINIKNIIQVKDSGYILVGGFRFGHESEIKDLIIKLDKYGNKQWLKVRQDTYSPNGLEQIFYDNNKLVGYRSHTYQSGSAPVLVYFDENGNEIDNFHISNSIAGFDVLQENDGYIVAGSINDFVVQKINKQGHVLWTEKHADATGFSISKSQDNNFIAIGGSHSGVSGEFLIKMDHFGKKIWSKPVRGYKVVALPNNTFIALTGHDNEKVELTQFESNGNQIWNHKTELEWSSISGASTDSYLLNYGLDNFVFGLKTHQKLIIKVINNKGNIVSIRNIPFNATDNIDDINIIKTLDNGLLVTYSGKKWNNNTSNFDAIINLIKISHSEIISN